MRVGVLDVQGDVAEHMAATRAACLETGIEAGVEAVRTPDAIRDCSALIIPGGESTTVGMLMERFDMVDATRQMAGRIPIFGTCAGMVMLAKEGGRLKRDGQPLLGLMDANVMRNAYGRQRESFEAELDIPTLGKEKFHGVFIRAPALDRVWGECESLCVHEGRIVLAMQGKLLACAFHPELTGDLRLHKMFLGMI